MVPYLSKEVFDYVSQDQQIYQISVDSTYNMKAAVSASGKKFTEFASLGDNCLSCLTVKNTGEICTSGHHEQDVLPIYTRCGKRTISPEQYMDYVDAYCPDIFHALCDGDTNEECSKKRALKSADRTEEFFGHCLERYKTSERLKNTMLIGICLLVSNIFVPK